MGQVDGIADGDVPFSVVTAPASSDDNNYNGLDADDVSVTNLDVDDEQTNLFYASSFTYETRQRGRFTDYRFIVQFKFDTDKNLGRQRGRRSRRWNYCCHISIQLRRH